MSRVQDAAVAAIVGVSAPSLLPPPAAMAVAPPLLAAATEAADEEGLYPEPWPLPPGKVPKAEVNEEVSRLPREITAALEDYIEQRGLQRKDIAARMGVSAGRISQILSGDGNLTLKSIATLCATLGIHMKVEFIEDDRKHLTGHSEAPANRVGLLAHHDTDDAMLAR